VGIDCNPVNPLRLLTIQSPFYLMTVHLICHFLLVAAIIFLDEQFDIFFDEGAFT
jgi:hypothetical protein